LLNYIPWDTGTRREDLPDPEAMTAIVAETDADGVYLDTMGQVPDGLREALDRVRPGLVFETEAMPRLPAATVLTGAWAQTYAPFDRETWANRWVEPRFSVRGVARELTDRRSLIAMGFSFGMGHVAWENIFGFWNPLQPPDRVMIRRVVALLRANADAFLDPDWEPVLPTLQPQVFANRWRAGNKTVYTLINLTGEAFQGNLLRLPWRADARYYDVWNGCELKAFVDREGGTVTLAVEMEPHDPGCIVELPSDAPCPPFAPATDALDTPYRRRVTAAACEPRPVERTPPAPSYEAPSGMVLIPSDRFIMNTAHGSSVGQGGCYDHLEFFATRHEPRYYWMKPFFMDRALVTNLDYREFLRDTAYRPREMTHFLCHWGKPQGELSAPASWEPPMGKQDHPVVWVDLDDARAYARWAGKRLPTEEEWQYAGEGTDGRRWPWGKDDDLTRCNGDSPDTTPVGHYPQGASPFGCLDMAGNVWEWTESERNDSHNRFAILKGGSHYRAEGSEWYMTGGAQPCACHLRMLLMYPGIDRHATIGFRCVKDVG
jgi:formylglycine-generating enzyme required for sulfatase activity